MTRGKKQHVLAPSEIKALKSERNEMAGMLKELEEGGFGRGTPASQMDKARIRAQVNLYDRKIEAGTPKQIRGASKDRLVKQAEELAESIKEGMPSRGEMRNLRDNPNAPFKNLDWQKRNGSRITEYKQLMRRLEPGDPGASNIEKLRRK